VLGTMASIMLIFLFALFLSILIGGEIAGIPGLISEFLPQVFQVGTIYIAVQWFIFGLVFYSLIEISSKVENK